jgi:hypothetical protein
MSLNRISKFYFEIIPNLDFKILLIYILDQISRFLSLRKFKHFHSNSNFHLNTSTSAAKNSKSTFLFFFCFYSSPQHVPLQFSFSFFPLFLSHTGPSAFDLVAQLGRAQGVIYFLKPLQAAVSVKLRRVLPRCALPASAWHTK